ncbi:hypothetical protein BZA70DRAFT_278667 [Myxozyma melibiosi]|uniref:Uncharacterized protein n=1 Tax=Myxozyma melibiosi TaxID=54550 RepID=A0ABR1F4X6_9ASCO
MPHLPGLLLTLPSTSVLLRLRRRTLLFSLPSWSLARTLLPCPYQQPRHDPPLRSSITSLPTLSLPKLPLPCPSLAPVALALTNPTSPSRVQPHGTELGHLPLSLFRSCAYPILVSVLMLHAYAYASTPASTHSPLCFLHPDAPSPPLTLPVLDSYASISLHLCCCC